MGPPAARIKVLSDFDGVWTDQAGEAAAVKDAFVREAAALIGVSVNDAARDFDAFEAAARAVPHRNGWVARGRLAAFVDEDVLLATTAVSTWLDRGGAHPSADRWRAGLARAGFESANAFAHVSFGPAMRRWRREGGHALVPGAEELVDALRAADVELVVASNSPPDKLDEMFADAGVTPGDGVRLVGGARKWWIDGAEPTAEVHGRRVHVDRPHYRALLERERPDVIVGDVVSLDLALAGYMRTRGELDGDVELLLKRHAHTPEWATDQVDLPRAERLVDRVVDSLEALLDRAQRS